jgi:hypothetical protein
VPLNILAAKLTLKAAKEPANLHNMYMPSKILLQNAQILLQNHKCETCEDLLAAFKPYKVVSNMEHQQTWCQKNTRRNVLNVMRSAILILNVKSPIKSLCKSIIGLLKMKISHQLHPLQSCARTLSQIPVLTLLQKCLKKLVAQFVSN